MADLFFYRDPEEGDKAAEEESAEGYAMDKASAWDDSAVAAEAEPTSNWPAPSLPLTSPSSRPLRALGPLIPGPIKLVGDA